MHGPDIRSFKPAQWALVVWLLGLVVAVVMVGRSSMDNATRRHDRFETLSQNALKDVNTRMQRFEYGLRGARGAVIGAGGPSITRPLFEAYSRSRDIDREFPGARGFGFIRRVPANGVEAFLASARQEGPPDFQIRQFGPHQGELFVIQYIEPLSRNLQALGLDIASEPSRKATAFRALREDKPTLSAPLTLLQASQAKHKGLLLMLPVYPGDAKPQTAEERQAMAQGWTYAPLVIEEVLEGLPLMDDHYGLRIEDVTDKPVVPLFESARQAELSQMDRSTLQQRQLDLQLFGRHWRLSIQSTPEFEADLHLTPAYVPAFLVLLLFSLLAGLIYATMVQLAHASRISEQQARLATIAATANDAIIGTDLSGRITDWNEAAERIFGHARLDAVGQDIVSLLTPQYLRGHVSQQLAQVRLGQRIPHTDTVCLRKDGSLMDSSVTVSPIVDVNGLVIGAATTVRDITPQKVAAERILALNATLEQQVKHRTAQAEAANRAKSAFLATMSHEIRTPMNALNGMAYLLGKSRLDDRQRLYVTTLQDACKDMLRIVDNILDLSKVEAGQITLVPQPFKVQAVVDEVCHLFQASAQSKGLTLSQEVDDQVNLNLITDVGRLKQILSNLIGNAVKFTVKGQVSVHAQVQAVDQLRANLVIRVKDTGIGMSEEACQRVFQPYEQADASTSRSFGGTGLGLSIVKHLIEHMGGQVGVDSQVGQGSEFWISLPCETRPPEDLTQPAPVKATEAAPIQPGDRLHQVRVMIVDDSEVNALIAQQILSFEGATVTTQNDGKQAVDWLIAHPRDIDVVLMDVQMPGMDGRQATRHLRHHHVNKNLPVIALTAGVTEQERQMAMDAGMNDFISKPFDALALVSAVETWAQQAKPKSRTGGWSRALSMSMPLAGAVWPDIPGIDVTDAKARFGGQLDLFITMLHRMVSEFQSTPFPEQAPHDITGQQDLASRLHKCKGVSGNLGASKVYQLTSQAEEVCRQLVNNGPSDASDALAPMLVALNQALSDLARHAQAHLNPPDAELTRPPGGQQATPANDDLLQPWLAKLRQRDLDALHWWPRIRPHLAQQLTGDELNELDQALDRLDFSSALAVIKAKAD